MLSLAPEGLAATRRLSSLSQRDIYTSESVLHVPDLWPTHAHRQDADDVEAYLVEARGKLLSPLREVLLGHKLYPGLLLRRFGLQWVSVFQPPPQLDLDEDQSLFTLYDQV